MFTSVLSQMCILFFLIIIGFVLSRRNWVPKNSEVVLSKLENYLFVPALVLSTFITNFTVEKLSAFSKLVIGGLIVEAIVIPIAMLCAILCSHKDGYIRNIYFYGLCFANFGFMGNAVVSSLFGDIFMEYILFTIIPYFMIYVWAVPYLLMENSDRSFKGQIKRLTNPMLIAVFIGIPIGLLSIEIPAFMGNMISSLASCMSPVAMLLTGMTIAKIDIKRVLAIKSIYIISLVRLLALPLLFVGVCYWFRLPLDKTFVICCVTMLAMPMGLNSIVIPAADGRDTSVAAGGAVVSHVLGLGTIPLVFWLATFVY